MEVSGAQAVYHSLRALGVDRVFGIVSVHNIPIYDAILQLGGIETVSARHEQAAVHMADAYARTTGRLGVMIASTGPGAANTVPGLYEAQFASSPLLMITGQVDMPFYGKGKGYLHEAEQQVAMLRTVTRRVESPRRVEDIADAVLRCGIEAQTGRCAPCAVEIPIDLQYQSTVIDAEPVSPPSVPEPDAAEIGAACALVVDAQRRVILAGGGIRSAGAEAELLRLAEQLQAPVVTTVNGRGVIPADHPLFAGVLQGPPLGGADLQVALQAADVVIAVGTRFQGGATTNFEMPMSPRLVHIDVDPGVIGLNYPPDARVTADAAVALAALSENMNAQANGADFNAAFMVAAQSQRAGILDRIGPDQQAIMDTIRAQLPRGGAFVCDATVPAYTWGNQLFPVYQPRRTAHPTSAAIGPGLPFAIGAAFGSGEKTVLIQGDGGFQLHIGELATAAQYKLPLVICLFNDCGYGVLRALQTMRFEGRTTGVDIRTPDFVQVAQGMGVTAERVQGVDAFKVAFTSAMAAEGPVLLDIDMTALAPIRLFG